MANDDQARITITCPQCGVTGKNFNFSNGREDDSMVSCSTCNAELGPYPEIRDAGMAAAKKFAQAEFKKMMARIKRR